MKRTELACYALIASAFVLAAMLLVSASRFAENDAYAEMVVTKDGITMLSTQAPLGGVEFVYVLDSRNGRLLTYSLDPNKKIVSLMRGGAMDLVKEFETVFAAGGAGGNPGGQRRDR